MTTRALCPRCEARFPVDPADLEEYEIDRSEASLRRYEAESREVRRRAETLDPRIRESIADECRMMSSSPGDFDRCVLDGERRALERREVERHADEYREGL